MIATEAPLAEIRVADLSGGLAGPMSAMVLGELGASVYKIETVDRGDLTRYVDPMMFEALNRSKRSLAVNLKDPRGLEVMNRLLPELDVIIHNFRPGVVERLGLGYDAVAAVNPRIIYAAFSGFGPAGPDSQRRAIDSVAQAETGMFGLNGGPGGEPTPIRVPVVDGASALALVNGILAALIRRGRTGHGALVESNLLATALFLQSAAIANYSKSGREPADAVPGGAPSGVFDTADGKIFLGTYYQEHFVAACHLFGLDQLADDPAYANIELRGREMATLNPLFAERIRAWKRVDLLPKLEEAGLLHASVRTYAETIEAEQIRLNQSIFPLPSTAGELLGVRLPFRLDGDLGPDAEAPPKLGQHSREILAELGFGAETASLLESGVVVEAPVS